MKNLTAFIFAAILSIAVSTAQERGPRSEQKRSPEEIAKVQTERLTQSLGLDKPQQDSIYKSVLKIQQDFKGKGGNQDPGKWREIFDKQNQKIKSFLTKEQAVKYDELLQQQTNRRK
ncbi:hypothetical protein ACL9RF_14565 [Sphingobacterium sp. Mn56C]|uniref:hypothetical protein n=1 Tax=Sphingobacterium sp. Mn56C TaxID=3395261 RepID=UPI003BD716A6